MEKQNGRFTFKKFWFPLFLFAVAVICFYKVVDRLPEIFVGFFDFIRILSPVIWGIVIAFLLYRPANALEKLLRKGKLKFVAAHARGISVLICYLAMFAVVAAVLYLVLPRIFNSVVSLVNHIPEYYTSLMTYLQELAGEDGAILGFSIADLQKELTVTKLLSYFDLGELPKYLGEVFKATGAVVDFFLVIVISIYVLLGRDHLIHVCGRLIGLALPVRKVRALRHYLGRTCNIFYSYIYSQLIDAVIVSVLCFIVFSIVRLPYALLLALLMGICNLIPYFGAFIGGAGVVLVTLLSTGNIVQSLVALACVVGAQQLDANVLQPRIVADSVGLRPIYVLIAITIGSGLFGIVGMLISVPIFAVIRMLIVEYMHHLNGEDTLLVKKQAELEREE